MKIQHRYHVFKKLDMISILSAHEIATINRIGHKLHMGRVELGKKELNVIVIEKGWPEYEPTLKLLSDRVDSES